jgi:hypothetical protein
VQTSAKSRSQHQSGDRDAMDELHCQISFRLSTFSVNMTFTMFNQTNKKILTSTRKTIFAKYFFLTTSLNFVWEVFHLPLYTLWSEAPIESIVYSVLHCIAGDVFIALIALSIGLVLAWARNFPLERFWTVATITILAGFAYTIYSELHSTVVTKGWSYSAAMPTLFGVGVSPMAQWLVIPGFIWVYLNSKMKRSWQCSP